MTKPELLEWLRGHWSKANRVYWNAHKKADYADPSEIIEMGVLAGKRDAFEDLIDELVATKVKAKKRK